MSGYISQVQYSFEAGGELWNVTYFDEIRVEFHEARCRAHEDSQKCGEFFRNAKGDWELDPCNIDVEQCEALWKFFLEHGTPTKPPDDADHDGQRSWSMETTERINFKGREDWFDYLTLEIPKAPKGWYWIKSKVWGSDQTLKRMLYESSFRTPGLCQEAARVFLHGDTVLKLQVSSPKGSSLDLSVERGRLDVWREATIECASRTRARGEQVEGPCPKHGDLGCPEYRFVRGQIEPKCDCYFRHEDGRHAGRVCSTYSKTGKCPMAKDDSIFDYRVMGFEREET